MQWQGEFAQEVAEYVTRPDEKKGKRKRKFEYRPFRKQAKLSDEQSAAAEQRRVWLKRELPARLEAEGYIIQQADGTYQDRSGRSWTCPEHQGIGASAGVLQCMCATLQHARSWQ